MYELRPYQREAVDAVLRHFRRSRRAAVVVLPTGAGKSLVIAELARLAKGRVLVLAHVKELVEQNFAKFKSYGLEAGIFSAGLSRKDTDQKVIFGSIQSVARADEEFFHNFSLLVIDECHRVGFEEDTQYGEVMRSLRDNNPQLCILGLTATPYRLDSGWIYDYHYDGALRGEGNSRFAKCVFELPLHRMIKDGYLTPPIQIDAPVASYDFSSLPLPNHGRAYSVTEIEAILKDQARVTPGIVKNILDLSRDRRGVIIFTGSVRHAREILKLLPPSESAIVVGDTDNVERDEIIESFKAQQVKFLVNVSVLTTGFDAPHVDLIAILRPTESVSLYQQIVGRGLRLFSGKKDCLILDYTGVPHDIFSPQINDYRPSRECSAVKVKCPKCDHGNDFWGLTDEKGEVVEHFGEKCRGATEDALTGEIVPCGFRYRFQICQGCGAENDLKSDRCIKCAQILEDTETKLQAARQLKDAHVMRPDSMTFEKKEDKKGESRLEIRYYDVEGQHLSEIFFFKNPNDYKVFYYNFIRFHAKRPELRTNLRTIEEAVEARDKFRVPLFIVARKQGHYWRVREKIFY